MKAYYVEPSGDYNLVLTEDELRELETTGRLTVRTTHIPCVISRVQSTGMDFKVVDTRDIESSGLELLEYCGDLKSEKHYIQFLHIRVGQT